MPVKAIASKCNNNIEFIPVHFNTAIAPSSAVTRSLFTLSKAYTLALVTEALSSVVFAVNIIWWFATPLLNVTAALEAFFKLKNFSGLSFASSAVLVTRYTGAVDVPKFNKVQVS